MRKSSSSNHIAAMNSLLQMIDGKMRDRLKIKHCLFRGQIAMMGSSKDGTKIGDHMDEFDCLYEVPIPDQWKVEKLDNEGHYKVLDINQKVVKPREIFHNFSDLIDNICSENALPEGLVHGGFASPIYSGCRTNGPAATLLLKAGMIPLSLDLTFGFSYQEPKMDKEVDNIISIIQHQRGRRLIGQSKLHLVPDLVKNQWLISTAKLEADILSTFDDVVPVKQAMNVAKVINHELTESSDCKNVDMLGTEKHLIIDKLEECLQSYENDRDEGMLKTLRKYMRFGHIFLPAAMMKKYEELHKPLLSINNACLKHAILTNALEKENTFKSEAVHDSDIEEMVRKALDKVQDYDAMCVTHTFLKGLKIKVFSCSSTTNESKLSLVKSMKIHIQNILQLRSQTQGAATDKKRFADSGETPVVPSKRMRTDENQKLKTIGMTKDTRNNTQGGYSDSTIEKPDTIDYQDNDGHDEEDLDDEDETLCTALKHEHNAISVLQATILEKKLNPTTLISSSPYFLIRVAHNDSEAIIQISDSENYKKHLNDLCLGKSYRFTKIKRESEDSFDEFNFSFTNETSYSIIRELNLEEKFLNVLQKDSSAGLHRSLNGALKCGTTSTITGMINKISTRSMGASIPSQYLCLIDCEEGYGDLVILKIYGYHDIQFTEGEIIQVTEVKSQVEHAWNMLQFDPNQTVNGLNLACYLRLVTQQTLSQFTQLFKWVPVYRQMMVELHDELKDLPLRDIARYPFKSWFHDHPSKFKIISLSKAEAYFCCTKQGCNLKKIDPFRKKCNKCKESYIGVSLEEWGAYAHVSVVHKENGERKVEKYTLFRKDIEKALDRTFDHKPTSEELQDLITNNLEYSGEARFFIDEDNKKQIDIKDIQSGM